MKKRNKIQSFCLLLMAIIFTCFSDINAGNYCDDKTLQFQKFKSIIEISEEIQDTASIRKRLNDENVNKANLVTYYYVSAQQTLFKGNFSKAMIFIDSALKVHENADIFALKGTIFFKMDSIAQAKSFFIKALQLDKNFPIPPSSELKDWLLKNGIIN